MSMDSPPLFPNVATDCEPVSTRTLRFRKCDEALIREEVKCLLKDELTEKSQSPW